ncbi:uncharacterized protein LTR77_005268 [Saxophila tyrrhenica]|uniref:Uncharacterized protein n=1 Tax=Saxophila tyrrhenica TaxID=1690608 RepID=A0AAV9PFR6_9PEZI|nr:hypothetical protein LTR77_005268 [Saxophila tyrrhenica]
MPSAKAKVACVEDCDSELGDVKEGTRREARRKTTSGPPPSSMERFRHNTRDGASDSGYSSHGSGTHRRSESSSTQAVSDSAAMPPPPRPAPVQAKSRPVVHPPSSQQNRPQAPTRTASLSTAPVQCSDVNCTDPNCPAAIAARRRSASYQYPAQYAQQYASSPVQYQQLPQYQYAQVQQVATGQPVPQLNAQAPLPSRSTSRQGRPASIHGYPAYDPAQAAMYQQQVLQAQHAEYQRQVALQAQQQQQQAVYQSGYGASAQYPAAAPVQASPTSPNYPPSPTAARTFSARTAAVTPNYDTSHVRYTAPLARTTSARTTSARHNPARTSGVPGAFPTSDRETSESDTDSEYDVSEEEYTSSRPRYTRDGRTTSSSSRRRPSMGKTYVSAPAVPTQSSRERLHRSSRSGTMGDYIYSSDAVDSDRTVRPAIERARTNYSTSTRSSRRPSQSTTTSSRTKSTNLSSLNSGLAGITVEDSRGRRVEYMSLRDRETILAHERSKRWQEDLPPPVTSSRTRRESDHQRRREQAVEDYQDDIRGGPAQVLTAEKLRAAQHPPSSRRRESVSGRSHHTSHSGASKSRRGEGITVESNGTVLHLHGEGTIEVQAGDDGRARLIVNGAGGNGKERERDSAYYGSKSSSSRVGRSRAPSEGGRGRRGSMSVKGERKAS